jgi:polar amino acid transport system substrate-binding protein
MKTLSKIALALAALALVTMAFTGCAKKAAKGKYLVATDTTFAPFEFEDASGKFVGIDMDILAAIAKDQGFEYELQVLGFNAAVQSLESKQSDGVIAGMSITEERMKKFDFSEPYFDSGVVMGIAADDTAIKGYADLKGKKVAIKTGTEGATFAESIKDQYGFTVAYFEDSANMYEDVKIGNSAACFEDYPVLGYGISQGIGLKIVTEKEKGSSYGFAVSKGLNGELLSKFNKGLANIKANGTYQAILDTYIKK